MTNRPKDRIKSVTTNSHVQRHLINVTGRKTIQTINYDEATGFYMEKNISLYQTEKSFLNR
jgi:hypothetical protein